MAADNEHMNTTTTHPTLYELTPPEDDEPVLDGFELIAYAASDEARYVLALDEAA